MQRNNRNFFFTLLDYRRFQGNTGFRNTEASQRYEGVYVCRGGRTSHISNGKVTRGDGRSCLALASRREHFAGGAQEQIFQGQNLRECAVDLATHLLLRNLCHYHNMFT